MLVTFLGSIARVMVYRLIADLAVYAIFSGNFSGHYSQVAVLC